MMTDLSQIDITGSYSYADYLTWTFPERVELYAGRVERIEQPGTRHQGVISNFIGTIRQFTSKRSVHGYCAPFDVRIPAHNSIRDEDITTVLQPDICLICDFSKLDDRGCLGAPDLVIEVLSPGNSSKEVSYKYDAYEECGVREYWIVYPEYEHVNIFLLGDSGKFFGRPPKFNGDILQSAVFPDLAINLSEVFEE